MAGIEAWPEIQQCKGENRRELSLKSSDIILKIEKLDGKLPEELFSLELLNFLEISGCNVTELSENVGNLKALTQFIISANKLQSLPDTICSLQHMKVLDISYNEIKELPSNFGDMINLQGFNANHNKLTELPQSFGKLVNLSALNISNNGFTAVPQVLLEQNHRHLSELKASYNEIDDVSDGISSLEALKTLDLSGNKIKELPQSLSNCTKLKQADYKDNPLKDRRLKKLIEQNNSSQKAIMDYIRMKGRPPRNHGEAAPGNKAGGKKKKKGRNVGLDVDKELVKYIIQVLRFDDGANEKDDAASKPLEIIVSDEIKSVRPYIVCCIVKRLDLSKENVFKKFLAIQTKLHEDICGKRTVATIASHDFSSLSGTTLRYDAKEPETFKIKPLGREEDISGLKLYKQLRKEAETMKREKKRSQVSGIYKYLSLLENQEKFPYLSRSSDDAVISLPPLTNSEISKIKVGTGDVLLEVTGGQSLGSCKSIMDKLLKTMLDEGMYSAKEKDFYYDSSEDEDTVSEIVPPRLIVQQVKILDCHGKLKVIYPSRTDLEFTEGVIKVERFH